MIDRPRSRVMMQASEDVLRPIIEAHKDVCSEQMWSDYQEGLIAGVDMISNIFELLNPCPPNKLDWFEDEHPQD